MTARVKRILPAAIAMLPGLIVSAQGGGRGAAAPSPYPTVSGKAYKFETIADGVYYATATGALTTGSNNPVIVGDNEVMWWTPAPRRPPRAR